MENLPTPEWQGISQLAAVEEYFRSSLIDPTDISKALDAMGELYLYLEREYGTAREWAKQEQSPERGDDRRDNQPA